MDEISQDWFSFTNKMWVKLDKDYRSNIIREKIIGDLEVLLRWNVFEHINEQIRENPYGNRNTRK